MKNNITILISLFIALNSFSQNISTEVLNKTKIVGKNLIQQKDIVANEFVFNERIYRSYVDSLTGYATLQLRKLSKNGKVLSLKGLVVVYDLKNKSVKWTKKIDYSMSSIQQYGDILILSKGNKIIRLNIENGDPMWDIKNDLYYVNINKKIGVGYAYNGLTGSIHTLEGINLNTGESLWQKELKRDYGWNKIIKTDASNLLIVAGGMHSLNIETGSGWDYETKTGKKDYTETIAKNVGGLVLGALTGTYVVSSGSNLVRDVLSNTIMDSTNIYMASKEKLACINKSDGTVTWSYQLPDESTSKSSLIVRDSSLVLINKGYAFWRDKTIDFGDPFILEVNKLTGAEIAFKNLMEKDNPIVDYKVKNDSLLLLFGDKITCFSLQDKAIKYTKTFDSETYGNLTFFSGDRLYTKNTDPELHYNLLSDSTHYFVQTSKGKTLKLDKDFNELKTFDFDNLYLIQNTINGHKFINQDNSTIILDSNNKPIGELSLSFYFRIINNTIYETNENSLLEIDLNQLLNTDNSDEF
ncbi:hypothetical protein GCM10007962_25310 [Yeosuana aromativorans]|uniref:Pyrrolo-quinoline quinone repeat domain-containing protein n=1 Tax=Yeosuana aromativorans TaxID=288019 RepID=A0A8J3BQ07_9FLAO|nr:PQQ-binding-like beta-propeller repeat protein [Yeosuana aromativorans]GGK29976.1 hypothetical protein GCM10007962_25310 [Yeosuana aromativorans]